MYVPAVVEAAAVTVVPLILKLVTAVPPEFFCDWIAYVTEPWALDAAVKDFVCELVENVVDHVCEDVTVIGLLAFDIVTLNVISLYPEL